jgi:hypothetical protein
MSGMMPHASSIACGAKRKEILMHPTTPDGKIRPQFFSSRMLRYFIIVLLIATFCGVYLALPSSSRAATLTSSSRAATLTNNHPTIPYFGCTISASIGWNIQANGLNWGAHTHCSGLAKIIVWADLLNYVNGRYSLVVETLNGCGFCNDVTASGTYSSLVVGRIYRTEGYFEATASNIVFSGSSFSVCLKWLGGTKGVQGVSCP